MDKIQVRVIQSPDVNPSAMTSLAARLTQKKCSSVDEVMAMLKPSAKLVDSVISMNHLSVTRHSSYTVLIFGASRRFLAQITRHHVGMDFTSGSLQYQDMSDAAQFVTPYELLDPKNAVARTIYQEVCEDSACNYRHLVQKYGIDRDTAGYLMPQGMRNILIMTGNVNAWYNVLNARLCHRNTNETRYVSALILEQLLQAPGGEVFQHAGPNCVQASGCLEGKMICDHLYSDSFSSIGAYIANEWPLIRSEK